jgi:hypothetical protein
LSNSVEAPKHVVVPIAQVPAAVVSVPLPGVDKLDPSAE